MTAHACLKNEFTEDEKYHNLMTWLIWAASWHNQQNGMCAQQRLRSAWASTESDQSFAVRMQKAWVLSYPLRAQRRPWSDWVDAQADLSLRWVHCHFVGFVMRSLIFRLDGVPEKQREDIYARLHIPNKQEYTEKLVLKSVQSRFHLILKVAISNIIYIYIYSFSLP